MIAQATPPNGAPPAAQQPTDRSILEQFLDANRGTITDWLLFKVLARNETTSAILGDILHLAMRSRGYDHPAFAKSDKTTNPNGTVPSTNGPGAVENAGDDQPRQDLANSTHIDFLSDERFAGFSQAMHGTIVAAGVLGCLAHAASRRDSLVFSANEIAGYSQWEKIKYGNLIRALRRNGFIKKIVDTKDPNYGCYRLVDFFE